jgi:L-threonylcarbamoyladenylate synthase
MDALPFRSTDEIAAAVPRVEEHLAGGGLLAYPTETVYGLGSRPLEADVASLGRLKGREWDKPFLLLVGSMAMAEGYGLHFSASARALADRFWPGPLTLVLPGGEGRLPDALRGPEGGIALRWTSHGGIATLLRAMNQPITSTSANRPGEPAAPGVRALCGAFEAAVDDGTLLVLDGGTLGSVPPSTVVDCTGQAARLIREGALPLSELRAAVGGLAP